MSQSTLAGETQSMRQLSVCYIALLRERPSLKTRRRMPVRIPFSLRGLLAVVALLVGLQALQPRILARFLLPTREARWIWIAGQQDPLRPVAFQAIREFHLPRSPSAARLLLLADEEAAVFLNDSPVAAVRYIDNRSIRAYDVQALARRGRNRLIAELRSSRGVGGFLLRLEITDAEKSHEIVSDSSWQIYRRQSPLPPAAQQPSAAAESPRVWGLPPIGRWGRLRRVLEEPTLMRLTSPSDAEPARRYRVEIEGHRWRDLGRIDRNSPALGSQVTFDWGREVVAYLALRLPPGEVGDQPPIGLLFTGSEPPRIQEERPDGYLVAMPGQKMWLDATPRRFRYVSFLGLCGVSGADAYLVDTALVDVPSGDVHDDRGAFGLRPNNLETALEAEIRRTSASDRASSS